MPFGKPKVFWFGANSSGLDSPATLALLARHAVSGYGWQTGHNNEAAGSIGLGEALQSAAVTHALDYFDFVGNNSTMVFQYRQIQVALRLFAQCAIAADNIDHNSFWLQQSGKICVASQPWGTSDPYWNFSNPEAANYWIDQVIGQLIKDTSLTTGRGAVFFDEVDQGECGYRAGSCDFSKFDALSLQTAKNAVFRRQVNAMNKAGIIPILSLDNRLRASSTGLPIGSPCALPEDDLAAALAGSTWVRFYENFPQSFWVPGGKDLSAAMVQNAILEAQLGIPNGIRIIS